MKTIISASRRTDIPAFYLHWFMDAIRQKELVVRNPLYRNQSKKVDLGPQSVEWIVFWSRDYHSFLLNHDFFADYELFFHFTILSHHPKLEKVQIEQERSIKQMEQLVRIYEPERVIWRYDPIVIWAEGHHIKTNYCEEEYEYLCLTFSSFGLKSCYFSFVSDYNKFKTRFYQKYPHAKLLNQTEHSFGTILIRMRQIAASYGIMLYTCCNDSLIGFNTEKGRCISGSLLNNIKKMKIVSEAKTPTRLDCGCSRSIDIGDYIQHPCHFGCIYCYANPVWK
jgi:hypothetical protein